MADSKLTDLPTITTLDNDDVLYIVDTINNTSNKITYANLINTRFNSLSTRVDTISGDLDTLETSFAITQSRTDTLFNNTTSFSLSFDEVTVANNSRFISAFNLGNTQPGLENYNITPGDVIIPAVNLPNGGLSGLQVQMEPVSANEIRLDIINTTGGSLTIPSSAVYDDALDGFKIFVKVFYNDIT